MEELKREELKGLVQSLADIDDRIDVYRRAVEELSLRRPQLERQICQLKNELGV